MNRPLAFALASALAACAPMEQPLDGSAMDASGADAVETADAAADRVVPVGDAAPEIPSVAEPLFVRPVAYNPMMIPLGTVTAVTESATTTAFYGSLGMKLVAGGALRASNAEITTWRAAATVPAGIGTGTWIVAADGMGRVHRVRPDNALELVSDRYGLSGQSVRWIAAGGMSFVGFATDTGIAVADGMAVRQFMEGPFESFAAGGGRFAGAGSDRVKALDAMTSTLRAYNLPGVSSVALDAGAKLVAAAGEYLWTENADRTLSAVFRARMPIRSLARSGARVWFIVGTELGTYAMGRVSITNGAMLPMNSTLVAASSDELWVLSAGAPRRYAVDTGTQTPEAIWRATIQPIYATSCWRCHGPGQTSPDLSTFAGWDANRMDINLRVVMEMGAPMPPDTSINAMQRMVIGSWIAGR